jgi:prophage DNA circulation protein
MIATADANEAAAIIRTATSMLLATSSGQQGRAGSDLRRACGDLAVNAEKYAAYNQVAYKLAYCFDQARAAGATLSEFNQIYATMAAETPVSLIATLMAMSCVSFSLQQVSLVLMATTFTSRDDVDNVRGVVDAAFRDAEEVAADAMAQMTYQTLVALHAAVLFHLYQTAQPLPQLLDFQFAAIKPTLVQSYRLYADASRADELRAENKVVHPAFAPRAGQALAF